MYKVSP